MKDLREHLLWLLDGGYAHIQFSQVIDDYAPDLRGVRPLGIKHTAWRLLEHMRIAQWDILEFSRNPAHVSPKHPEGYWPTEDAPPEATAWERSVSKFEADGVAFRELIEDTEKDLYAPFPWGDGQTLLREALLLADHNAYHLGQLVAVKQALEV